MHTETPQHEAYTNKVSLFRQLLGLMLLWLFLENTHKQDPLKVYKSFHINRLITI